MADAPTDLVMTDRDHESLTLSWKAPAGYDPGTHAFRIDYAKDQEMSESVGSAYLTGTSGTIHKLGSNTNYYVRVRMMEVTTSTTGVKTYSNASDRTESIIAKTRSPMGKGDEATVVRQTGRDSVFNAAMINASYIHSTDLSEGIARGVVHPGTVVVPAAFAAWIRCGSGGTYWWTRSTACVIVAVSSAFFFSTSLPFTPPGAACGGGALRGCFWTVPSGP
jgi:hypothetical protein